MQLDIPQEWKDVLTRVQGVCPDAVLAGGALRDLDNKRPVNDLDIFVSSSNYDEAQGLLDKLRETGIEVSALDSDLACYPEDQNLEVVFVAYLEGIASLPVQIVFTDWPTDRIVERFDYGICRLSYNGATIVCPPEYIEDKKNNVFRLCRERPTPISMRGSVKRYARLTAEKYGGWDWQAYEEVLEPVCVTLPCLTQQ